MPKCCTRDAVRNTKFLLKWLCFPANCVQHASTATFVSFAHVLCQGTKRHNSTTLLLHISELFCQLLC
jgi:hypothetical protein